MLYFAEVPLNFLSKYSQLFIEHFLLPSLKYNMNSQNCLHVFGQIYSFKVFSDSFIKDE